jgi:hypothetical protein
MITLSLFKKSNKVVDERIENLKNRIFKEAYILTGAVCTASILVKFILYGVKFQLVMIASELLIIIIPGIYSGIRSVMLGIYSDEIEVHDRSSKMNMDTKTILAGAIPGALLAIAMGIRSSLLYGSGATRISYFFTVFLACLMIYCPFYVAVMWAVHSAAKKASKNASQKNRE